MGVVALNQSSERVFGHIHTLRGSFCQVALNRKEGFSNAVNKLTYISSVHFLMDYAFPYFHIIYIAHICDLKSNRHGNLTFYIWDLY